MRDGLLPPGHRVSATQADYDEEHLRRLRLIATLVEVGGLPLGAVRDVLAAVDDPATSWHDMLGVAHRALDLRGTESLAAPQLDEATREVEAFVDVAGHRELGEDEEVGVHVADDLGVASGVGKMVAGHARRE